MKRIIYSSTSLLLITLFTFHCKTLSDMYLSNHWNPNSAVMILTNILCHWRWPKSDFYVRDLLFYVLLIILFSVRNSFLHQSTPICPECSAHVLEIKSSTPKLAFLSFISKKIRNNFECRYKLVIFAQRLQCSAKRHKI